MVIKQFFILTIFLLAVGSAIELNVISPEDGAFYNTTEINFTIEASPNASSVQIDLNGTCSEMDSDDDVLWTYISNGELSDGCPMITFNATNGNESVTETIQINIDTTPPEISWISPENTTYDAPVELNFHSIESNPDTCVYELNGSSNDIGYSNGTLIEEEGSHHLVLTCSDLAGNTDSIEQWFVIDIPHENQGPVITITDPENEYYDEVDEFEFKVTDDNATELECFYRVDSGSWEEIGSVGNDSEESVDIDEINDNGKHEIEVKCSDGAIWTTENQLFKIDNEGPSVKITIEGGATTTKSREVEVKIETDNDAEQCRFKNGSSSWGDWDDPLDETVDFMLTKGEGKKIIYYECEDDAGNSETASDSITLIICGNGQLDEGEVCDGNLVRAGYRCSSDCSYEYKEEAPEPKTTKYELSLPANTDNEMALNLFFNNSSDVYAYSEKLKEDFEFDVTIKKENDESIIDLECKYKGNKNLENVVFVVYIPKSFASDAKDITVNTNAEVQVLEEDPVFALLLEELEKAGSLSVSFETDGPVNLLEVKQDFSSPTLLAKNNETIQPKTRTTKETTEENQEPIELTITANETAEEHQVREGNQTTEESVSLATGLVIIGGTLSILLFLGFVLLVAVVALFFFLRKNKKKKGVRM